jgi:hypothetical protein
LVVLASSTCGDQHSYYRFAVQTTTPSGLGDERERLIASRFARDKKEPGLPLCHDGRSGYQPFPLAHNPDKIFSVIANFTTSLLMGSIN